MSEPNSLWPTQDGVDRSESFSIIAVLTPRVHVDRDLAPTMRRLKSAMPQELEEVVNRSIQDLVPGEGIENYRSSYYQVGPAADGLFSFSILTIWENRDAISTAISTVADAWAVSEIVQRVVSHMKGWVQRESDQKLDVNLSFPPEVLTLLCLDHVQKNYHPRAKLEVRWYSITQETFAGYISPSHPSGQIEYIAIVSTAKIEYVYRIKGDGEVLAHSYREGRRTGPLPLPVLIPTVAGG